MTIVLAIGFCIETAVIIWLAHKANKNGNDIFKMDFQLYELRKKINGKEEAVEVLSESVRKLNWVVKDLEQKQPKIEPKNSVATRAFLAGWDADATEPEDPVKKHIVDICLNGTCEQKQGLIDALTLQNILLSQTQQCNYQTLRGDLLSQTQQCILPWRQTPSGAILPLWYVNRRLEDM